MVKEVVQDYQHAVLQVSDTQYDEDIAINIPQVSYEFPNGYHDEYGVDRFKIAEALFDPIKIRVPNANTMLSMAHVLTTSVGKLFFKPNIESQPTWQFLSFFRHHLPCKPDYWLYFAEGSWTAVTTEHQK